MSRLPQVGVLLISEMHIVAAPAPSTNAPLELSHVFRVASQDKGTQPFNGSEMKVFGLAAHGGSAVTLYEVDHPEFTVLLEIEQDTVHGGIVGPLRC